MMILVAILAQFAVADEGMWLLNQFPKQSVEKKYGFKATDAWLKQVQRASVRLAEGCSGSFVSNRGLVLTNHHCVRACVEQLSRAGADFAANGFIAKELTDEARCPEAEVNRLESMTDVTEAVLAATRGKTGSAYQEAQRAKFSAIEKDCARGDPNTRCDVVTLFQGGAYHLYRYQRYQDVRLVFAPEDAIAFFGGDPDNFMFPRYDFDMALLRVYDQGRPLATEVYFPWAKRAAERGDLVFVTGHPGSTSRLDTIAELEFERDVALPRDLIADSELRGLLTQFQKQSSEAKRVSQPLLFGIENGLKADKGKLRALLDPAFFKQKRDEEAGLRRAVAAMPAAKREAEQAWKTIPAALATLRQVYPEWMALERNASFHSKLYRLGKLLLRSSEEALKPNGERLREYSEARMPEVTQDLESTAPIDAALEIAVLEHGLTKLREELGVDHPAVRVALRDGSPAQVAAAVVRGTRLGDLAFRSALIKGGHQAVSAAIDPLLDLVKRLDPLARKVRKRVEDEIQSKLKQSGEQLARARFKAFGTTTYPDATFTLRISYGAIEGYLESDGRKIDPITRVSGLYERTTGQEPFALPLRWVAGQSKLDPLTPFNFASTNDIIGGNSGSPVINKAGEIVGLIFDGNIQSLGGDYGYDARTNRAVAVHGAAIPEALAKLYEMPRIVEELTR